ncbi:hypothetical protein [Sinomonas sp. ASV322]|uniref:hypothetical protein n=1 Tax=Sinomonas sp. ASV322 TaxID=3041920 RepID=UPI0027DD2950|nr:hypothetical protein [Sinomonas sp. ASV322]MDQ4504426.1 hypothetical protein [Sinomonas sp. ASV322]
MAIMDLGCRACNDGKNIFAVPEEVWSVREVNGHRVIGEFACRIHPDEDFIFTQAEIVDA